ncbi:hypothetical protein CPC08DRAFT_823905 [Agrocybe pediades]|nr:hypothetical protein CPC08DRAFT_823905 [Agrocybe pediades]
MAIHIHPPPLPPPQALRTPRRLRILPLGHPLHLHALSLPGNNIPKPTLSRRIAYIFDSKEYRGSSTSSNKDKEESKPALSLGRVRGGVGKMKFLGVFGVPPGREQFSVKDNKPLTDLIESFRRVVCMYIQAATLAMAAANRNMRGGELGARTGERSTPEEGRRFESPTVLTYPVVQKMFEEALSAKDWAEDDISHEPIEVP